MNSNWQIEQSCPQCGAPVVLEEADRILTCPFCRTRLYLAHTGYFSYHIPVVSKQGGEVIYIPYWRLKGAAFSASLSGLAHRFVDANAVAVKLDGLQPSLGLRPQTLKLHFTTGETPGRFIAADRTLEEALPQTAQKAAETFSHNFIGETVNRIYSPLILRNKEFYDGVLGKPYPPVKPDFIENLLTRTAPPEGEIKFIPTLCPHCGWDMEGKKEAAVMTCGNCQSAWALQEQTFEKIPAVVVLADQNEKTVYLPFWRMKTHIDKIGISSRADLIRIANLPRAITPELEKTPLYFWSPAFKINPNLYARLCRQMTVLAPCGKESQELPAANAYTASLPVDEAREGITANLAGLVVDRKRLYPLLADLVAPLDEYRLEYHPFLSNGRELVHRGGIAVDLTALSFGMKL